MAVDGVNGTNSTSNNSTDETKQQGFAGLNSDTFLKLLMVQLQNQDPLNPTSNEDLLNQLSAMRSLQANIEITDTLNSITSNQQLATAAGFLGKTVLASDEDGEDVTGVVTSAYTREGVSYLGINGQVEVRLSDVQAVKETAA